jgi:hypothetical protein
MPKRKAAFIDLTEDSADTLPQPVKKRESTPHVTIDLTADSSPEKPKSTPKSKQRAASTTNSPSTKEEKRLKRWRNSPTVEYKKVRERALTQRMFVLDRARTGTAAQPEETVTLAGSTGNVYTVRINSLPSCNCPHAQKGHQCKHLVYVLTRVLRAPTHLEHQLALLTDELREIFDKAPPIPRADAAGDGRRKEIEGECPICCVEFDPAKEEIVYCKAACGNNLHKMCFDQWAASQRGNSVTCPFCRTAWVGDEEMLKKLAKRGKVNDEGYVNVAGELGLSGERGK